MYVLCVIMIYTYISNKSENKGGVKEEREGGNDVTIISNLKSFF